MVFFVVVVFLLPSFTHLEHACQDLLGPCDEMHVCTDMSAKHCKVFSRWKTDQA